MWSVVVLLAVVMAVREARSDEATWFDRDQQLKEADELLRSMVAVNLSHRPDVPIYKSRLNFNPGVMKKLYAIAPPYIRSITDRQPLPPGFIKVVNRKVQILPAEKRMKAIHKHYRGTMRVLYGLLAIGVIILIVGVTAIVLFFVLRSKNWLSGNILIILISILLLVLLVLFIVGAIFAIKSELHVRSGLEAIPLTLNNALDDVSTFIHDIRLDVQHSLVTNYAELMEQIRPILSSISHIVNMITGRSTRKSSAARSSFSASLLAVQRILAELDAVRDDLKNMRRLTASLRLKSDHLNAGLGKIKYQLRQTLAMCQLSKCAQLLAKINLKQLDIKINYNQIPDVSNMIRNVSQILDSNLTSELVSRQHTMRQVRLRLAAGVERSTPLLQRMLNDTGARLDLVVKEVNKESDGAIKVVQEQKSLVKKYNKYRSQHELKRLAGAIGAPIVVFVATEMKLPFTEMK